MTLKNPFQKYVSSNDLILILALIVGGALIWNTVVAMQKNYRLQQKFNRLTTETELLELENQNLTYQIAYLKTDAFLELAARDKFNKAAPGETLVYLPGSGEGGKQAVATPKGVKKQELRTGWRGNLEAWWRFLSGNSDRAN
jgi:cell division protein FtsB